jgi:hypothetical protein
MLKWERKKKNLTLAYKEKKRFLTRSLFLALTCALLFHVAFFMLFHIDLGMLKDPVELPPLTVTSSLPAIQAYSEKETPAPIKLAFLETPRPETPEIPHYFSYNEEASFRASPMVQKKWTSALFLTRGFKLKNSLNSSLEFTDFEAPSGSLLFEADGETGKIYFFSWKKSTGNPNLDKKIEELLKTLTVELPSGMPIAQGEIEVRFHD